MHRAEILRKRERDALGAPVASPEDVCQHLLQQYPGDRVVFLVTSFLLPPFLSSTFPDSQTHARVSARLDNSSLSPL